MPVLGSPGCEWLWCLVANSRSYLSLALQEVSGCGAMLQLILLIMPVLGSSVREWLWYLPAILAC